MALAHEPIAMSHVPGRKVSVVAEFPEDLHRALTLFLIDHPQWDHDQLISAALSSFLVRQGTQLQKGMASVAPGGCSSPRPQTAA